MNGIEENIDLERFSDFCPCQRLLDCGVGEYVEFEGIEVEESDSKKENEKLGGIEGDFDSVE